MTPEFPSISTGTFVRTTQPNYGLRREWTDEVWASKKWGIKGKVIACHDAHGISYEVRHEDGTLGCYDPSELEVIPDKHIPCNLQVKQEMMTKQKSGKVRRAVLYTCNDYGVPSRNNTVESHPRQVFEGDSHTPIMEALKAFATCPERCKLVLKLDNGWEIDMVPALKDNCPAFGESDYTFNSPVAWDILVNIWPG